MTEQQYEKISAPFRGRKASAGIKFLNKALTAVGYTSYPLMLRYLYFTRPAVVPFAVAVPASGFFLLTFVRKKINRPRPYEALDINPIIIKNTKGKSMPSRHVFSMTVIAVTAFLVSPAIGAFLLVCSGLLAAIRAVAGVHYPSDVTVGFVSAVVWGAVLYSLFL